jgi:mannose-6-phosphate isomerase
LGVDRRRLEQAVAAGKCNECLHQLHPNPGDCVFIEAGTVHALGAGLLVAEIQQASDTTYRLFDWNRVDRDGKPRPIHVRESLDTIDFSRGPVEPRIPKPAGHTGVERLVECTKFVLDRWKLIDLQRLPNDDRFHILATIEGSLVLTGGGLSHELRRGDTVLVPACSSDIVLKPRGRSVVLDMFLP